MRDTIGYNFFLLFLWSSLVILTFSSSFLILLILLVMCLLSNSIWSSPGPPRKPLPPLCLSKCVQDLTNLVFCQVIWASSTCKEPSLVAALAPKISSIRAVLSNTLTLHNFSKFLCWIGVIFVLIIIIWFLNSFSFKVCFISSILPLPKRFQA